MISRETVRLRDNWFDAHFAACFRRNRPHPNDKWHMGEVVIPIGGVKHWLWRAIDANWDMLDILVQIRRNAKAAKRFLTRLIAQFGRPRVVITDKLSSYTKPIARLAPDADRRVHKGLNNRIEGSHRPTRRREKIKGGGSTQSDRRNVFSPPMTRSTQSSNPAAIVSPLHHTATRARTLSVSGNIVPLRSLSESALPNPFAAGSKQLGNARHTTDHRTDGGASGPCAGPFTTFVIVLALNMLLTALVG